MAVPLVGTVASADGVADRGGRPSVWDLDPELEGRILASIEAGDSERVAAEAEGIGHSTLKDRKSSDAEFSAQCKRARARGLQRMRRELMETDNPVWAKVRLHALGCKDREEWSARYAETRIDPGQEQEVIRVVRYVERTPDDG